jgi:CHAT domain-containing protein
MSKIFKYFVLAIFFFCSALIINAQNTSPVNQSEDNKIVELSLTFLKAYARYDLKVMDSLCAFSAEAKKVIRQPNWANWENKGNLVFDGAVNQFTKINKEKALARITLSLREEDLNGKEILNPMSFDFSLIKDNSKWKISNIGATARWLSIELLSAQDNRFIKEIIIREKKYLNSDELTIVLEDLQDYISQNQKKIIKIIEIIVSEVDSPKYKAAVLYEQGRLLLNSNKLTEAEKVLSEAQILSQTAGNELLNAQSLILLGEINLKNKKETEADQLFTKGVNYFLDKSNLLDQQLRWIRIAGNDYFNEEKYEQARKYYIKAEELAEKANNLPWQVFLIKDIGDCDFGLKRYAEALQYYRRILAILERPESQAGFYYGWGDETINLPIISTAIAFTLEKINQNSEAEQSFLNACDLAYKKNSAKELHYSCGALVEYYFRISSDQKAIESFSKLSEKLFELKAESELVEEIKDFIIILALEKGKLNQSEKVLEYWSGKISPEKITSIYLTQLVIYERTFKWSLSQEISKKIIDSKYSTDEEKLIAIIMLAEICAAQHQKREGLNWVKKAEIFAKELNDKYAIALVSMFKIIFVLDEDNDIQNITELQKIIEENADSDFIVAFASYWLGASYISLAEDDYKANSELVKKGISIIQKSIEIYNRPKNKEFRFAALPAYFALALIYKETGEFEVALETIKKAKEIISDNELNLMQGCLELLEAEIQIASGNITNARESFKNGIEGIDQQRRFIGGGIQGQLNYYAAFNSIFKEAVANELKSNNIENAIAITDLAKGRILRELTQKGSKPDWLTADETLKGVLSTTVIIKNGVNSKASSDETRISIKQTSDQIKTLEIDNQTAVLDYLVDDDNIHLFVLTSEPLSSSQGVSYNKYWQHYIIKYDYLVEYKIKQFQNILRNNKTEYREIAKELYRLLLKPAEKQISGKSTLIILPDSFLWQVPFQALIIGDSANKNEDRQEKFVIEQFAVQYAFSLTNLINSRQVKKERENQKINTKSKNILAIGNSTFKQQVISLKPLSETSFPFENKPKTIEFIIQDGIVRKIIPKRQIKLEPLPGAIVETNNLLKVYGVNRLDYWLNKNATKSKFIEKASSYKIIHIATHGILDDENPLNSSLVFSDFNLDAQNTAIVKNQKSKITKQIVKFSPFGEEYLLTAEEILSQLRLNADLVVLSACDTANGEVSDGEGLIGLTWAFLGAGALNVVANQWKVEDGKTPELMKEFHRQLQDKKQNNPIPVALQKSVKTLLDDPDYYHPYYWAGFVSIGAP